MLTIANVRLLDQHRINWNAIHWQEVNGLVSQIRQRIYRATAAGDITCVCCRTLVIDKYTADTVNQQRSSTDCLSRVRSNSHARFLGEKKSSQKGTLTYPTWKIQMPPQPTGGYSETSSALIDLTCYLDYIVTHN